MDSKSKIVAAVRARAVAAAPVPAAPAAPATPAVNRTVERIRSARARHGSAAVVDAAVEAEFRREIAAVARDIAAVAEEATEATDDVDHLIRAKKMMGALDALSVAIRALAMLPFTD